MFSSDDVLMLLRMLTAVNDYSKFVSAFVKVIEELEMLQQYFDLIEIITNRTTVEKRVCRFVMGQSVLTIYNFLT